MTDLCNSITCPDGNCEGCRDGQKWCQDPRCDPYCGNCTKMQDDEYIGGLVTLIIVACLMVAFIIMLFLYGPSMIHYEN